MQRAPALEDRTLTLAEYGRLPEETDGAKVELVRGRLVRERGPAALHGRLQSRIAYHLERHQEDRQRRGAVIVNAGFVLADEPATVRIPDVAYVSEDRIPPARYAERWWRIGPDLAVEVTSPSNTWTEIQEKVGDYFGGGTRVVWVVDPATRTVTVYRPAQAAARLEEKDVLDDEDVLPGLRIRLAELFDL